LNRRDRPIGPLEKYQVTALDGVIDDVVERRSSTIRGSLRTAIVRRGESSIGSLRDADLLAGVPTIATRHS